jgi:hypothetical protein
MKSVGVLLCVVLSGLARFGAATLWVKPAAGDGPLEAKTMASSGLGSAETDEDDLVPLNWAIVEVRFWG